MTNINELYDIADTNNIPVDCFGMTDAESFSIVFNGKTIIVIDPLVLKSTSDEKVKLAHELGHCVNGAFYNMYSPLDVRSKHEHTANKWAIKKLIPEDELKEACKYCRNRWELSEHFGVTEDFMQKALDYYSEQSYN